MDIIRPLHETDFHKGFLNLLNQLTPTSINVSFDVFCEKVKHMNSANPLSCTCVIEHHNKIVATGKLLIEMKLHNNFAFQGHIEDVVVLDSERGKGLGKRIIQHLKEMAFVKYRCYKVVLNCNEKNVSFYEKCGFRKKGQEMCVYLSLSQTRKDHLAQQLH